MIRRARLAVARASSARGMIAQCGHQLKAGVSVEFFGCRHFGEGTLETGAVTRTVGPALGQLDQISPLVAAGSWTGEELIDPTCSSLVTSDISPLAERVPDA